MSEALALLLLIELLMLMAMVGFINSMAITATTVIETMGIRVRSLFRRIEFIWKVFWVLEYSLSLSLSRILCHFSIKLLPSLLVLIAIYSF